VFVAGLVLFAAASLAGGLATSSSQQIGGALGLAVLTAVASSRTESAAGEVAPAVALGEGFQTALLVAAGIVVVAVVLNAVVSRGTRPAPAAKEPALSHGLATAACQPRTTVPAARAEAG
jgi:hypothetical protein